MRRLPRWVHRLYANAGGYFWLPCPICQREFGGHEVVEGRPSLKESPDTGWLVCSDECGAEAHRRNAERGWT